MRVRRWTHQELEAAADVIARGGAASDAARVLACTPKAVQRLQDRGRLPRPNESSISSRRIAALTTARASPQLAAWNAQQSGRVAGKTVTDVDLAAFIMRGMSQSEIARQVGVSRQAVSARLKRIRK